MLSAPELALLARELDARLKGARCGKIYQLSPARLLFRFDRARDGDADLLVVLEPPHQRALLVSERPPTPREPTPLAEELRRGLKGARLGGVRTLPGDRVLVFDLAVKARPAGKGGPPAPADASSPPKTAARSLIVELFPRGLNLLLTDEARILACLRDAPAPRPLRRGIPYEAPAPPPAREEKAAPFAFLDAPPAEGALNEALAAWVEPREAASEIEALREGLLRGLSKVRKKREKLVAKLERELEAARASERARLHGELLKTHLHEVRRGQTELLAPHWESGEEIRVPLDAKLSPQENLQHFFDRARKQERAAPQIEARLEETREELRPLVALAEEAEGCADLSRLRQLDQDARRRGWVEAPKPVQGAAPRKEAPVEPRKPYRTFVSSDGWPILVGRTARDNDELTFQVARGNDYWFHVAGVPGSHVVVRNQGELPPETLLDAAMLALLYSRHGKSGGKHEVSWTLRKWVAKFRGANAGQVQMSERRTLYVRLDPERLERLKKGGPRTA
jgi:predicted ribosome quality control (RQC) complex YloA/Tae2 family protein